MAETGLAKEVKTRPIIFSAWKVGRILAWDFKRHDMQTRRVITPQPLDTWMNGVDWSEYYKGGRKHLWLAHPSDPARREIVCPYGQPGDRLWVRETWHTTPLGRKRMAGDGVCYRADEPDCNLAAWVSPIFMPRWASRITLELTGVRVERVQDITEADAKAEGVAEPAPVHGHWCDPAKGREGHWSYRKPFAEMWNSINAKRGFGWDSNPFVWVLSFKRVTD